MIRPLGVWTIVLLAALTSASAQQRTLPEPDLSALEPLVAQQLAEMRQLALTVVDSNLAGPGDKVKAWGDMAKIYHSYELLDAAEACYQRASELDPESVDWPYMRAHAAIARGELDQAAELLTEVLAASPDDVPALVFLADVERERNHPDAARGQLERARDLAPKEPAVWARLGEQALADKNYQEAVDLLSAVLEVLPQVTRLHYPLGLAYRGLGDLEQARRHLALRGEVGLKVADPRLDELALLQVGERVHLLRGKRAYQAGDMVAAVEEFRGAVAALPESARARVNLAAALAATGDATGALGELELAVALEPGNVTARFNLATLLASAGQHRLALPHFLAATEAAPKDEEVWLGEARSWIAVNDFARAVLRLERASALAPDSGRIAYALGRLRAAAPDLTVRDGTRALDLAQRVFEAQRTPGHGSLVGLALRELGRCDEARGWLDDLLANSGELPAADREMLQAERAAVADGATCRP